MANKQAMSEKPEPARKAHSKAASGAFRRKAGDAAALLAGAALWAVMIFMIVSYWAG